MLKYFAHLIRKIWLIESLSLSKSIGRKFHKLYNEKKYFSHGVCRVISIHILYGIINYGQQLVKSIPVT